MEAISAIEATTCHQFGSGTVLDEVQRPGCSYGYGEDPCGEEEPDSSLVWLLGLSGQCKGVVYNLQLYHH